MAPLGLGLALLGLALLCARAGASCPPRCVCTGDSVDCSRLGLTESPQELPHNTHTLNLSYNKLRTIDASALTKLPNLRQLHLGHNELTSVPSFGEGSSSITSLYLHHNRISSVVAKSLRNLSSLETLDLSNNDISEVRSHTFPAGLPITDLYLGSNRITHLDAGAFDALAPTLQILRLSRNRISHLPVKAFQLPRLTQLDLSRNRLRLIEGLTFQGLTVLEVLKLQRNNISRLTDGAFFGLARMKSLHLDYNRLSEVNSGSLYGLSSLLQLFLNNNSISHIKAEGWRFCPGLRELNLSYNNLSRIEKGSLAVLENLQTLRLGHNTISHITEGAFRGLRALIVLELDHNDISGTIEDTSGTFAGLESLHTLTLFGNKIKSVAEKAFSGLEALEQLDLRENELRSVHRLAFERMKNLRELRIQSDSFLCDCHLHWLPEWLQTRGLQHGVVATCAHPETLKGSSIYQAPAESFVCDDLLKPQMTVHPESVVTVLGTDVRLTCTAASSSSSPVTFSWRKDSEFLREAELENFAHVGARDGEVMEYTTVLTLPHVTFSHEGRYQCIITNHFGSSYSSKASLFVNVLPSFVKTPGDLSIRTGTTARLECAAQGHPAPQIAWQKDGGTDFPAARERRMHVMPDDDVFFITDVKPEDTGVYSCTAQNSAGTVSANATLTVLETPHLAQELEDRSVSNGDTVALQCKALGSPPPRVTWLKGEEPVRPSDRLHFTPGNRLLVIRDAQAEDAGRYTCVMSNRLGTERAHSVLTIRPACVTERSIDQTVIVGVIVIAVVTSIVLTSLVWVCVIYQTRKKSEECSVTNTDETTVPPDVPSYLSSQGTLSERQDGCIRVDSGGRQQPNGGPFSVPVVCTDCLESTGTYSPDPDYVPQTFCPALLEYQQNINPKPDREDPEPARTLQCNGTPSSGREAKEAFPSNHDRMASAPRDRAGVTSAAKIPVSRETGEVLMTHPHISDHAVKSKVESERFHKPVRLDSGCGSDVGRSLLRNGQLSLMCEDAPLRRASD